MMSRRVSIPVTHELSWVLTVPELCLGQARVSSPESLRDLEAAFAPAECPTCARFVERAIEALSMALDEVVDEPPPGDATD